MHKKERAGLSGKQKIALAALCLLTAWQIVQNDKITNALAALLFGGVIPGTNKVLPPETMMYIAGGVGVLVAISVTAHFIRRSRRLHPQALHYEIAQAEQAVPTVAPETEVAIAVHEATTPEDTTQDATAKAPRKALKQIARTVQVLTIQIVRVTSLSVRYTIKGSVVARKNIVAASIATWRWAEPRFRQFDRWLEIRVRDIQKWGRKKAHQHEDAQLFFDISRRSVKLLNQFTAKSIQKMSIVQKPRDEDFSED